MKTNKIIILSSVVLGLGAVSAQAKPQKSNKHSQGKAVSKQVNHHYKAVKHGKTTYYVSGKNYYLKKGSRFVKVKAPKVIKHGFYHEKTVSHRPRGSRRVTYRGQTCYVHNGIFYRQSGRNWISFRIKL